jgi:NitT/TauT family transport system substrate-binding protein
MKMRILLFFAGVSVILFAYGIARIGWVSWTRDTITIAVAEQPAFALMFIADRRGYFLDEGLNVTFNKHALGRDALRDVIDGRADLATVFDIPTLISVYQGHDLGVVTSLHTSVKNHAVAAFKSKGIESAQDLRGKKIAFTKNISTDYFLNTFLFDAGIDSKDVDFVNDDPERYFRALEDGSVDAAVLFNPYLYNFRKVNPESTITLLYSNTYTEMSILAGRKDYVLKNGDKMTKVLRALRKAEQFIQTDKEEAVNIVDTWLTAYDREGVLYSWDIFDYTLQISNSMLLNMEREAQYFLENKTISGQVRDLRSLFVTEFLKTAKPEGVTLY